MSVGAAKEFLLTIEHDMLLRDRLDEVDWDPEQAVRIGNEMGMIFDEEQLALAMEETGTTLP
jgi:hypothetical protein